MNDFFFQVEARERLRNLREEGELNQKLSQDSPRTRMTSWIAPGAAVMLVAVLALAVASYL